MRRIEYNIWTDSLYIKDVTNLLFKQIFGNRKNKAKYCQEIQNSIINFLWNNNEDSIKEIIIAILLWEHTKINEYKEYYYSIYNFKELWVKDYYIELYKFFRSSNLWKDFLKKFINDWNIYYCPYCNKNEIEKSDKNYKIQEIYSDLDHIIEKSNIPLFDALNLKNMIPACVTCNRFLKWAKSLKIWDPFWNNIYDKFDFHVSFDESWDKYSLTNLNLIQISIDNENLLDERIKNYLIFPSIDIEQVSFDLKNRYNWSRDLKELIKEKFLNNYDKIAIDLNYNQYSTDYNNINNFHSLKWFKLFKDLIINKKYSFKN